MIRKLKCSRCNKTFPEDNFYPSRTRKSGHDCYCKKCNCKYGRKYYVKNIYHVLEVSRKWRLKNKLRIKHMRHENYLKNKAEYRQRSRKYFRQLKKQVIDRYGKICKCCGEKNIGFLSIDHIHGGGGKHRRELGLIGYQFYRWLVYNKYPSGYQVLCLNCNMGRAFNNGICPHKKYPYEDVKTRKYLFVKRKIGKYRK